MDIIISINNNEKVMTLPICPLPNITTPMKNQNFNTLNGPKNLIGKKGLKKIRLSSFFPNQEYSFIRPNSSANANEYIDFFEEVMDREIPARFIWISNNNIQLNLAVTLDNFNYKPDESGDISYSMSFTEFPL